MICIETNNPIKIYFLFTKILHFARIMQMASSNNFHTYCIALMRVQVCVTLLGLRVDVLHYNTPCFRILVDGSTSLEKIKIQLWTRDTNNLEIRGKPRNSWEKMR
jgi:hypothetical protein